jgi:hypothetical protein
VWQWDLGSIMISLLEIMQLLEIPLLWDLMKTLFVDWPLFKSSVDSIGVIKSFRVDWGGD